MNNLFNLSNLIHENELFKDIRINDFGKESYLSSSIRELSEMNDSLLESTKSLYVGIAEAESTKKENECFATYFKEYKDIVSKNTRALKEEVSRFKINMDTLVDANSDLLNHIDAAELPDDLPKYKITKYRNLDSTDLPKISPYKIFKREYRFLAKLLQDLGPTATDEAKAKIVATVYNNLTTELNAGWMDKVVSKITGDSETNTEDFATAMYSCFVEETKEVQLTPAYIQRARMILMNYNKLVDTVISTADEFLSEINEISTELGKLFFRNEDNILDIKTDIDGLLDKKYRLSDYSFNQVDQFMKIKANQITEIYNLFIVALSIKMDCIAKCLLQAKDVIETVKNGIDETPNVPDSGETDTSETNTDDTPVVEPESDEEIESECYLFEASIFLLERAFNELQVNEDAISLIYEDARPTKASIVDPKKFSFKAIIDSLITFVKKIAEKITNNYDSKIKHINDNKDAYLKITKDQIPAGWTIQTVNFSLIENFKIQDFNKANAATMADDNAYFKSAYSDLAKADEKDKKQSIITHVQAAIIDTAESPFTVEDIKAGVNYITNTFKKCNSNIEAASKKLKEMSEKPNQYIGESSNITNDFNSFMEMYFAEDSQPAPAQSSAPAQAPATNAPAQSSAPANDSQAQGQGKDTSLSTAFNNYIKVNSYLCSAMSKTLIVVFNKYYKFLVSLIPENSQVKNNNAAPATENKDTNNNTGNNAK